MSAAHLHLAINHLPIFGLLIGLILVGYGLLRSQTILRNAGLVIMVALAVATIPVSLSGEEAEEIVEDMPGISHDLIHEHEEAAELGLWLMIGLGAFSLVTLLVASQNPGRGTTLAYITFAASLLVFGWMSYVGNTGGQINHPELHSTTTPSHDDGDADHDHEADDDD